MLWAIKQGTNAADRAHDNMREHTTLYNNKTDKPCVHGPADKNLCSQLDVKPCVISSNSPSREQSLRLNFYDSEHLPPVDELETGAYTRRNPDAQRAAEENSWSMGQEPWPGRIPNLEPSPFDSIVYETQETPAHIHNTGKEKFKKAISERAPGSPITVAVPPGSLGRVVGDCGLPGCIRAAHFEQELTPKQLYQFHAEPSRLVALLHSEQVIQEAMVVRDTILAVQFPNATNGKNGQA
ncbi:hypothetical protein GGS26DRAFT_595836 [Hypomontagnella submonticulosa]|nr:hypothetical protein GGS26DRAFT_595836 [Hypomontagnella submonticulosa]